MIKFLFTDENFVKLQGDLYKLSDEALRAEAELIQHDFLAWMSVRFNFSDGQIKYFDAIKHKEKKLLAFDISFAVENRLPMTLNKLDHVNETYHENIGLLKNKSLTKNRNAISYITNGILQINIKCLDVVDRSWISKTSLIPSSTNT